MSFIDDLGNKDKILSFYGITPPGATVVGDRLRRAISRAAERANNMKLDGLIVYDVADESDRTDQPRPFAYSAPHDPMEYSSLIRPNINIPVIVYKCLSGLEEQDWERWVRAAVAAGIEAISIVGLATSRQSDRQICLDRAYEMTAAIAPQLSLCGVVIAERHNRAKSECERLLHKARMGCDYFVSQVIYDPQRTIRLLRDYADACARNSVEPKRVFLTFAPCGTEKTTEFMRWLGIAVPEAVAKRVLSAENPLRESITTCVGHFRQILDASSGLGIPLGFNVESVSGNRDEVRAVIDLHEALYEVGRVQFPA